MAVTHSEAEGERVLCREEEGRADKEGEEEGAAEKVSAALGEGLAEAEADRESAALEDAALVEETEEEDKGLCEWPEDSDTERVGEEVCVKDTGPVMEADGEGDGPPDLLGTGLHEELAEGQGVGVPLPHMEDESVGEGVADTVAEGECVAAAPEGEGLVLWLTEPVAVGGRTVTEGCAVGLRLSLRVGELEAVREAEWDTLGVTVEDREPALLGLTLPLAVAQKEWGAEREGLGQAVAEGMEEKEGEEDTVP